MGKGGAEAQLKPQSHKAAQREQTHLQNPLDCSLSEAGPLEVLTGLSYLRVCLAKRWDPCRGAFPAPPDLAPSSEPDSKPSFTLGRFARNLKGQLFSCFQNLLILSGLERQQKGFYCSFLWLYQGCQRSNTATLDLSLSHVANIWSRTTLRVHFACLPLTCLYPMLSVSQHDQHPHT